jgi:SAM-dependent methyltransferase
MISNAHEPSHELRDVAARFEDGTDLGSKFSVSGLYDLYESYLRGLTDRPITLLELGVHGGTSLKTFASYFPKGKIIGMDIKNDQLDFTGFPNIVFARGDQRKAEELDAICAAHAPDGLDVIIDDASHYGAWSLASYMALFPHLKAGGLYFIEDWTTGYWDDWPDGSRLQTFGDAGIDDPPGRRIPSHDFGMVGLVKYLVEEVASGWMNPVMIVPDRRPLRMETMHIYKQMVVLRKASGDAEAHADRAENLARLAEGKSRGGSDAEVAADTAERARVYAELARLAKQAGSDRAATSQTSAVLAARNQELDAIKNSTSWRITAPVRLVSNALARLTRSMRGAPSNGRRPS